jgi:hypothetical protein
LHGISFLSWGCKNSPQKNVAARNPSWSTKCWYSQKEMKKSKLSEKYKSPHKKKRND